MVHHFCYTYSMTTKNPRIHTLLEPPLYAAVEVLAKRDRVSLSQKVRDLVRQALETLEDVELDRFAEERRSTFHPRGALTPAEARRRLGLR